MPTRKYLTPEVLHDSPLQDRRTADFHFDDFSATLARLIASPETDTPFVIGINGAWGSGKTSLLMRVKNMLAEPIEAGRHRFANTKEEEKKFRKCKTVWFDAWKHNDEKELLVALVRVILNAMQRDGFMNQLRAWLEDPHQPSYDLVGMLINAFEISFGGLGAAFKFKLDPAKYQEPSPFKQHTAFFDYFSEAFERLLALWVHGKGDFAEIKEDKGALVIFIDDLDRCLPDKTVQVLEALKLFFDKRGCVFVLGFDINIVQKAIESHYKNAGITGESAKDYLEKVIQLRFDLPPILDDAMEKHLRSQGVNEAMLNRWRALVAAAEVNPRRVKNVINDLNLQWFMAINSGKAEGVDRDDFICWQALMHAAPASFVRQVLDFEDKAIRFGFVQDALKWQKGTQEEKEGVKGFFSAYEDRDSRRLRMVLKQISFSNEFTPDALDSLIYMFTMPRTPALEKPLVEKQGQMVSELEADEGIMREPSATSNDDMSNAQLTIIVDADILKFTLKEQGAFIFAISRLTGVATQEIHILQITNGSVVLTLELPVSGAKKLMELFLNGDAELQKLNIRNISMRPISETNDSDLFSVAEFENDPKQSVAISGNHELELPVRSKPYTERSEVFISYCRKDREWLEKLKVHLKVFQREKSIQIWDDTKIKGGAKWRDEIKRALSVAKVAVLLVTPDFLASDFIVNNELPPLLQAAEKEGIKILWIAVRPSLFDETVIGEFQAINDPASPLSSLSLSEIDKELVRISKEIYNTIHIAAPSPKPELEKPVVKEPKKAAEPKLAGDEAFVEAKDVVTRSERGKIATPHNGNRLVIGGLEFLRIPKGKFVMGSKDDNEMAEDGEKPQHTIDINYDYWMAKFILTNEQYAQYLGREKYTISDWQKKKDHPVVNVSWDDAMKYCQWFNRTFKSELGDLLLRLPTEAEWEKAARGAYDNNWPWGNEFDTSKCNSREAGKGDTTPVGAYSATGGDSPYGCADMAGNVWEWMHTLYTKYPYVTGDGRENEKSGNPRVLRGGSFNDDQRDVRCAYRNSCSPDFHDSEDSEIGFRVCISPVISL
jgi:formylglycine-generating enzyme required for sulfatase activity